MKKSVIARARGRNEEERQSVVFAPTGVRSSPL